MDRPSIFALTHPAIFSLNIFYTNWFYVLPYSRWIALSNSEHVVLLVGIWYVKFVKDARLWRHTVVVWSVRANVNLLTIFLHVLMCMASAAVAIVSLLAYHLIEKSHLHFLRLHTKFFKSAVSTLCCWSQKKSHTNYATSFLCSFYATIKAATSTKIVYYSLFVYGMNVKIARSKYLRFWLFCTPTIWNDVTFDATLVCVSVGAHFVINEVVV